MSVRACSLEQKRPQAGSLLAVASIDLAGMALPTIVLLGVEMALGVPFLLLVEGWGSAQHMILAFAGKPRKHQERPGKFMPLPCPLQASLLCSQLPCSTVGATGVCKRIAHQRSRRVSPCASGLRRTLVAAMRYACKSFVLCL